MVGTPRGERTTAIPVTWPAKRWFGPRFFSARADCAPGRGAGITVGVSEKRTVVIQLAGAKYRMTSDAEEGQLQKLADIVNERIVELGSKTRSASSAQLLAVVALGLADDLVAERDQRQRVEELTRRAVRDAVKRIDDRLTMDAAGPPAESVEG